MSFHGSTTGRLALALLTGLLLAASGWSAADNSPTSPARKLTSHASVRAASAPAHHIPARGSATVVRTAHLPARRTVASNRTYKAHPVARRYAARNSVSHHTVAPAGRRTTTVRYTAQRHAVATRGRYARSRPALSSSQQRWARVHLEPERVQEIQQALIREGYLHTDPTGLWDAQTRDAMLHFQTDHGFSTTGLPEAKSLLKLGLGPHPLAPELDHGPAGVATPGAARGPLPPSPGSPSITPSATSQNTPPSL